MNPSFFLALSLSFFDFNLPISCSHLESGGESKVCIQSPEIAAPHNRMVGRKRLLEDPQSDSSDDYDSSDYESDSDSEDESEDESEHCQEKDDTDFRTKNPFLFKGVNFINIENQRLNDLIFSNFESVFADMGLSSRKENDINILFFDAVSQMSALEAKARIFLESLLFEEEAIVFVIRLDNDIFNKTFAEVQEMRYMAQERFADMSVESVGPEVYFSLQEQFSKINRVRDYLIEIAINFKKLLSQSEALYDGEDELGLPIKKASLPITETDIKSEFEELIRLINAEKKILNHILESKHSSDSVSMADSDAEKTTAIKSISTDIDSEGQMTGGGKTFATDSAPAVDFFERQMAIIKSFSSGRDVDNIPSEAEGHITGGITFATSSDVDETVSEGYMTGGRTAATDYVSNSGISEGYMAGVKAISADREAAMISFEMHMRTFMDFGDDPNIDTTFSEGFMIAIRSCASDSESDSDSLHGKVVI